MKLKMVWKACSKFVETNLTTILSITAVVGLVGSVATAIIDTPKAQDKIIKAKLDKAEELERNDPDAFAEGGMSIYRDEDGCLTLEKIKLSPWEYTKILVPTYWKTGLCMIISGTCTLSANHMNKKQIAALATALSLRSKEFGEYKEKVKELLGEKKVNEIQQELAKDTAMNVPDDGIYETGHGKQIFYEPIMQRYFRSSIDYVKNAWTDFKNEIYDCHEGTLTQLYYGYDIPLIDTFYPDRITWIHEEGDPSAIGMIHFEFATYDRTGEHVAVIVYPERPDLG